MIVTFPVVLALVGCVYSPGTSDTRIYCCVNSYEAKCKPSVLRMDKPLCFTNCICSQKHQVAFYTPIVECLQYRNITLQCKICFVIFCNFQADELQVLRGKSPQKLWLDDLDMFLEELEVCIVHGLPFVLC